MDSPTPADIKAARAQTGLTQKAAAELIGYKLRAWEEWEGGRRHMRAALWELWKQKAFDVDTLRDN